MKKILVLLMCCLAIGGCGKETKQTKTATEITTQSEDKAKETQLLKEDNKDFPTSEQLLLALKSKNENLVGIDVFDENTDPNGNLGRPGNYITKADFSDSRVEQVGEYLCGGTIETFSNKDDCKKRADYLKKLSDPSMGAFGVNQYIYEYDLSVFRVEYDLTPEQAEEYHSQMTEIIEEWKKTGEISITETIEQTQNTVDSAMDEYKKKLMESAKDFEVTYENSDSFFEIAIKTSEEVSKLTSDEMVGNELFNAFSLSAGYLCSNFEEGKDYRKAGELAFRLIKYIATDDEQGKKTVVEDIKSLGSQYGMEVQTLSAETVAESETIKLEPIELSTGNYVVGEDIQAGKYDIVGVESGNVYVSSNGGKSSNVLIESIVPGETVYKNLKLEDGYIVEIVSGGKVRLEP